MFDTVKEATVAYNKLLDLISELEINVSVNNNVDPDGLLAFNRVWKQIGELTDNRN